MTTSQDYGCESASPCTVTPPSCRPPDPRSYLLSGIFASSLFLSPDGVTWTGAFRRLSRKNSKSKAQFNRGSCREVERTFRISYARVGTLLCNWYPKRGYIPRGRSRLVMRFMAQSNPPSVATIAQGVSVIPQFPIMPRFRTGALLPRPMSTSAKLWDMHAAP